ncbi:MAG: TrbC/VirB2 family protein [Rickettsiales bacterium]|nr:TrbC/VirB2 family protein [Rickettsiales bacterium]
MNNKSYFFLFSFFALVIALNPSQAFAADTQIEATLCNILYFLTGTIGKAIAAFALVFLGISLFLGKVSWGLAISTALGVATIFGAPQLVETLGGSAGGDGVISPKDCRTV